ncbi:MAG TPA: hypothetical protein VD790_00255 [Thermoleophilaceae bacterium]|nr:hypothetical protein [Thermoleophilaceae bacterium]
MRAPTVVPLSVARARPRIHRTIEARRRLTRPTGRVWLNGREVGGTDPRYEHLGSGGD